jgi:hypothetical protein
MKVFIGTEDNITEGFIFPDKLIKELKQLSELNTVEGILRSAIFLFHYFNHLQNNRVEIWLKDKGKSILFDEDIFSDFIESNTSLYEE